MRDWRSWLFYLSLLVTAMVAVGFVVASFVRDRIPRSQPVTVTACIPEDWATDGDCDAPVRPGILTLTEDLEIAVAGQVCTDERIAVNVQVAWEHVESTARFPVVDVPITWDPDADGWENGCNRPYGVDERFVWVPPREMLALLADAEPGEDLGQWRIVGRSDPVDTDKHRPYQWDSVETFRLLAPSD